MQVDNTWHIFLIFVETMGEEVHEAMACKACEQGCLEASDLICDLDHRVTHVQSVSHVGHLSQAIDCLLGMLVEGVKNDERRTEADESDEPEELRHCNLVFWGAIGASGGIATDMEGRTDA